MCPETRVPLQARSNGLYDAADLVNSSINTLVPPQRNHRQTSEIALIGRVHYPNRLAEEYVVLVRSHE